MAAMPLTYSTFDLDTGDLALDFANTLEGRYDDPPRDLLNTYADLVAFALQSQVIDEHTAEALRSTATERTEEASEVHAGARELREAIFGIYSSIAAGDNPDSTALATLNRWLALALPHGGVALDGDVFHWEWDFLTTDLRQPLWPIAYAAMDLLLHGPTDRLRECAADDCGWLFVDTTRNRARRWCSMKSCGNRAKVQQFRERARRE